MPDATFGADFAQRQGLATDTSSETYRFLWKPDATKSNTRSSRLSHTHLALTASGEVGPIVWQLVAGIPLAAQRDPYGEPGRAERVGRMLAQLRILGRDGALAGWRCARLDMPSASGVANKLGWGLISCVDSLFLSRSAIAIDIASQPALAPRTALHPSMGSPM